MCVYMALNIINKKDRRVEMTDKTMGIDTQKKEE